MATEEVRKRFSSLLIPVFETDEDLFESYPALKNIDGFTACKPEGRNEKIRYIFAMYDKKSPLSEELADLENRKKAACEESGLSAPLDLSKEVNLRMVLGFLFYQSSEAMTMITYLEENFARNTKALMRPSKKDDDMAKVISLRSALRKENGAIKEDLDLLRREVFGDNTDVYDAMAKVSRTSPEAIAKMKVA